MFEKSKNGQNFHTDLSQKTIVLNLIGGLMLTMTHGGFLGDNHHDMTPKDFSNKVVQESHTHNHIHLAHHNILADPRHFRGHTSNSNKLNRFRGSSDNWDIYLQEA